MKSPKYSCRPSIAGQLIDVKESLAMNKSLVMIDAGQPQGM
jgi:hypothetical protein